MPFASKTVFCECQLAHHFARHLLDRPHDDPRDRIPRHDGNCPAAVRIPGHQNCIILLRTRPQITVGHEYAAAFEMDLNPAVFAPGCPKFHETRPTDAFPGSPRRPEGKAGGASPGIPEEPGCSSAPAPLSSWTCKKSADSAAWTCSDSTTGVGFSNVISSSTGTSSSAGTAGACGGSASVSGWSITGMRNRDPHSGHSPARPCKLAGP